MALFFSGAVTSSPIKRRLRGNHSCHSPDVSLLSPDSSYVCYPSADAGAPCCCRRSPRLLTNGYYDVTEDSFCLDEDGNVSLTDCRTSVSYKENLVRVFRRRRKPRSALVSLLSGVSESCQSWLDQKVFRGMLGTGLRQNPDLDLDPDLELDLDWPRVSQQGASPCRLDESLWAGLNADLDDGRSFTYDPTEAPPPPGKEAPPPPEEFAPPPGKLLIQEEICSEISQSTQRFTQSLSGLSEVPPPPAFYSCCQAPPEPPGLTMKALLILIFSIFIISVLYSGSCWWSAMVTAAMLATISAVMFVTKSGPMGEWRRAKTEDITSRNE
ncbi:PREDICTED: transmembrane protein 71 [Poecilia mexicana]|uniref:transmembrane protein 71 n=1 Tax=Poecilia mexicana TaxID=48701 RepID=UPI00072DCC6D|nr:PREDICTED: transmembrane protein 71 [Poecilia mexicana]XP_014854612.1 PREDICTED: transmembrane protein 71 [Poecilia mexicana]